MSDSSHSGGVQIPQKARSSAPNEELGEGIRGINQDANPEVKKSLSELTQDHTKALDNNGAEYTDIVWTKKVTISQCAHEISRILNTLLRKRPDDAEKEECEDALRSLTEAIPEPQAGLKQYYPHNYLSEILMINYTDLVKFCSLYLNLTLSSHVTKFVVNLFYSLECWEIYHLLQMVPNLDYFLRLVDIEVTETPFGHVVSPPENYMGFNLRQGFQYPFPFPFYNFSYHTMNPDVTSEKYQRLKIDNYIDIRLNKLRPKKKKKTKASRKLETNQTFKREVSSNYTEPLRQLSTSSDNSPEYVFQLISPDKIELDLETFGYESDPDDGYNTEEAEIVLQTENRNVSHEQRASGSHVFVPSIYQEISEGGTDSSRKVLHQCQLLDPVMMKPCKKIFHGKDELQRHQDGFHADTKKVFSCSYCKESAGVVQYYPREDLLLSHIKSVHHKPDDKTSQRAAGEPQGLAIGDARDSILPREKTHPHFGPQGLPTSEVASLAQKGQKKSYPQGEGPSDSLPRPPAFITSAPVPASIQFAQQQYEESRGLPYYGQPARQLEGSQYPLPQFPQYAPGLPGSTNILSPQLNKRKEEVPQEQSPQLQQYYTSGFQAFQPYGQPFYGADGRVFMHMPAQQAYGFPMGVPQAGLHGPQNLQNPQYHQQQYQPMHLPPLGYQYHTEAAQRHGSPHMQYEQSLQSPAPPGSHARLPHIREAENPESK